MVSAVPPSGFGIENSIQESYLDSLEKLSFGATAQKEEYVPEDFSSIYFAVPEQTLNFIQFKTRFGGLAGGPL